MSQHTYSSLPPKHLHNTKRYQLLKKSIHHFHPLQPSPARLRRAGGRTAAGTAPRGSFTSDSRSASPVPKVSRSEAAAPSPAGRTRPGAPSALCVNVGGALTEYLFQSKFILNTTDLKEYNNPPIIMPALDYY